MQSFDYCDTKHGSKNAANNTSDFSSNNISAQQRANEESSTPEKSCRLRLDKNSRISSVSGREKDENPTRKTCGK